jgi:hypothetical protein
MRSIIVDVITALTGIAVAGLVLHNSGAAADTTKAFLSGYSGALSSAGSTK